MSDANILKKILEAENAGRELVREAQAEADRRVHHARAELQKDFDAARETKLRQVFEESRKLGGELERLQKERLAEFEQSLRSQTVSFDDATRELKKILSCAGGQERV
jgi:vacuolar-type H+-ATPase subunit H